MPIKFTAGSETLSGKFFGDETSTNEKLLMLHGGLMPAKNFYYLAKLFAKQKIESFSFDHSGHGDSSGVLGESSLSKRVEEARLALKVAKFKEPINLCAFSMGGYVAIKLTEKVQVKNLILFCPAVYDEKAFEVKFNAGFTEIIRAQESWNNSDAYKILENFKGNLLVIIGDQDEKIPPEVIGLLKKSATRTKKKEFIFLQGCTHQINKWLTQHPTELDKIIVKLAEFIK